MKRIIFLFLIIILITSCTIKDYNEVTQHSITTNKYIDNKLNVINYYNRKIHYQIITDSTNHAFLINVTQDSINYLNSFEYLKSY